MELYTRRQLVLLLGLLGAALAGLGVAHWRARHPDLVDRLEQWDRAPSRADRSTARRSVSGAEDEAGGAGEAADPGRGAAEPLGSLEVPRHRPVKLPSAPTGEPPPGPLDLNRAGPEELVRLPGVGPALAARIVAAREAIGRFHSVDDLDRVRGLGRARVERLRPLVVVGE